MSLQEIKTQINSSEPGSRDFNFYCRVFDLGTNGEALQDKYIIDLGSSNSNFIQELQRRDITQRVVSLDPAYEKPNQAIKKGKIAGVGQFLPFTSEIFDMSLAAQVLIFMSPAQIYMTLSEMRRVTKPNGRIKIYPVQPFKKNQVLDLPSYVSVDYYSKNPSDVWHTLDITNRPDINQIQWKEDIEHLITTLDFAPSIYVYLPARRIQQAIPTMTAIR